jgi:hypothetical protein
MTRPEQAAASHTSHLVMLTIWHECIWQLHMPHCQASCPLRAIESTPWPCFSILAQKESLLLVSCRLDDFGAAFAKMQTVCGRTTSSTGVVTITRCTLSSPTAGTAAASARVQKRVAAITSAPHVSEAIQQAAAAADAAAAANAAEPFVDPKPVVVPLEGVVAEGPVSTIMAGQPENGGRRRAARKLA